MYPSHITMLTHQIMKMSTGLIETRPIKAVPTKQVSYGSVPQCVSCFEKATTQALFELENAIIVQNYCRNCLLKIGSG